jgi:hypothetical protein
MNIRERDDQIVNGLNNILMEVYDTPHYKKIEKEIETIIKILERERVITKRRRKKG